MRGRKRTAKGNVTAKAYAQYGNKRGAFPVFDRRSAQAALNLRGHSISKAERASVIQRAGKYLPAKAKAALAKDKAAGKV